jgi:hypothetical protein
MPVQVNWAPYYRTSSDFLELPGRTIKAFCTDRFYGRLFKLEDTFFGHLSGSFLIGLFPLKRNL